MFIGLLTLITALTISAVAIYYSVSGLVAIFAAAAVPIIIMGGALEIGKLVTALWLHRYWRQARWWLKTYLSIAVLVLMFITSMGIFGFLSKAHIEQTAASNESVAQIARIETELARNQAIIDRSEAKIIKAEESTGTENTSIQQQIDAEQARIDSAYTRIQPAIDEQLAIIDAIRARQDERVAVFEDEIASLDAELDRLNSLVTEYRAELAGTSLANIEAEIKPYVDQIAQLDADLERINTQANEYEARISAVQADNSAVESLQAQIATIEESIVVTTNKLQSRERDKIREGQSVIGVTSDGLFGSNTRRALAAWVEAQQSRIAQLQAQETELRTQAQNAAATERARLTDLVRDLRGAQTESINNRKQTLLDGIDTIRENAAQGLQSSKDAITEKIESILNQDIPANRTARVAAQAAITEIRNESSPRETQARDEIARQRANADAQIAASNDLVQRLRDSLTVGADQDVEAIVARETDRIRAANAEIDKLTETKYTLEAETRKLEAEVGPVKYLAEFIYGEDADKNTLEEAVRWVIIVIIFVFDPLAVLLLIASQYTFEWRAQQRRKTEPIIKKPEPLVEPIREEPEVVEQAPAKEDRPEKQEVDMARVRDLSIADTELTELELETRIELFPPNYRGKLAPTSNTLKQVYDKKINE